MDSEKMEPQMNADEHRFNESDSDKRRLNALSRRLNFAKERFF